MEWSLGMMVSGSQRLRDLERVAKGEKRAIWTNYVPPPTTQVRLACTCALRLAPAVCVP